LHQRPLQRPDAEKPAIFIILPAREQNEFIVKAYRKMIKRIDIVHYHLKSGGVTSIIRSQIESLKKHPGVFDIRIFCGECPNPEHFEKSGVEVIVDKVFGYANFSITDSKEIRANFEEVSEKSKSYFRKDRLIYFHNLNLGKNPYWTLAIAELAKKGFPVFNHAHDFSEDRPANQQFMERIISLHFKLNLKETMYPHLPNYHMGVLNQHDYRRVEKSGFNAANLHYLPNPIGISQPMPLPSKAEKEKLFDKLGLDAAKGLVTYPVRAIRRKNIGEFILLQYLFRDRFNFVITLAPDNKVEVEEYNRWKDFCQSNKTEVVFEAGTKVDFRTLLGVSDFCLTTSIREGFGMIFLEPWMHGTPVVGRNLPMVTNDLKEAGIIFPALYNQIIVNYNNELVDFPQLDYGMQREALADIIKDKTTAEAVFVNNSHLKPLFASVDETTLTENQHVILKYFSLTAYGERLHGIYSQYDG
jgi:glycosyltransferase involved in cell wall biosynthesis